MSVPYDHQAKPIFIIKTLTLNFFAILKQTVKRLCKNTVNKIKSKGVNYEKSRCSRYCCYVSYTCFDVYCYGDDVYALFRVKEYTMGENKKFFWIVCIITAVGAIYWSAISMLQQSKTIFTVFLIVNIVVLIVDIICFIIDKKKKR